MRAPWLILLAAALGCAEDARLRLLDVEGPRGAVEAPGPWGVAVLTDGHPPRLWWAIGDDAPTFAELPLAPLGGGQFTGAFPPAAPGVVVRYYAEAAGERLPPADTPAYRFEVVRAADDTPDAAPPPPCALVFNRPVDGQTLFEAIDDNAPQFGLQLTVRVGTDLPPGHAVRLRVGEASFAGRVGVGEVEPGEVAFGDVTLANGPQTLIADAVPPGDGAPCEASARVEVVPRR